ncbi:MAG: hypothetical protein JF599_00070, partial [Verrucomicrobia bacterium]|nr:hypothetical protein [Verrucomicrobiota bacterium]
MGSGRVVLHEAQNCLSPVSSPPAPPADNTQLTIEGADSLTGPWERIGDIAQLGYPGRQVEGPAFLQFNQEQKWALLVDKPGRGGYFPIVFTNFDDPRGFKV